MCGIFGIMAKEPRHFDHAAAQLATIAHRGPDERGHWMGGAVYLGNCRLSIIDLTGGHQPIFNEDRTCCIVFNGELYNFLELRPELQARGHIFHTHTDTEVILHGYEEWGEDCLKRLNGMFAFAIWDNRKRTLFIARDRIGEKPLYYYRDNERFIFASEIKAIVADASVPRRISPTGLSNFLAFGHGVAPHTIYQDIYKLRPGHYMLVRDDGVDTVPYWDVGDVPQLPTDREFTEAQYAEKITVLLDDSVRRRMIADVPVGAFLSGGVDSSVVVALMKRHATGPLQTFSLGFTIGGSYNELPEAKRVAQYLGTEHHELAVEHADLVRVLRTLVYQYDEPFGDAAAFPTYLLSQFARQYVKVVLTGEGGDELFGGYRRYAIDRVAPVYQRLPHQLVETLIPSLVDRLPRLRRLKRIAHSLAVSDPARRYASWLVVFSPEMQADLLQPQILSSVADHDPFWQYPQYYAGLRSKTACDHLNRLMYIDLKTWLADTYLEKVDKATMACSLEGRLPILDYRLVELAFQIPGRYKIKGWSTKRIFKRAVERFIPMVVLRRPKHGFAVPTDPWFRGDLKNFTFDVLLDQRTSQRGLFNMTVVERLWREHLEGRHAWDAQLWMLLNLEIWQRLYLDREAV